MKTEDHLALGCYLLAQENVPQLRRHCIAFLLGCIEPDYNRFSYLRGILHHRKFRGHNAENSFAFLMRCRAYFALHEAYAAAAHGLETDCKFIFAACSSLLRQELARIPANDVGLDAFMPENHLRRTEAVT